MICERIENLKGINKQIEQGARENQF